MILKNNLVKTMKRNNWIVGILVAAFILLIGGVSWWYLEVRSSLTNQKTDLMPIQLRLKWLNQAQFAGNYVAVEKGFYREQGLSVTTVPFNYGDSPIDAVLAGKAQFGIAGADEIMIARTAGKPVKAIAVIYRTSPVVAFSLKNSGITRPQDFIGKRVGIERGQNVEYLYKAMMSKLKIDRSKIKEVTLGTDASELINGSVDVSTGYIINEPQLVVEAGKDVNIILMADYGVNMYADVLFTTDAMAQTKPEIVQEMTKATIDGWQYAIEHPSEAIDDTMKYVTTSSRTHQEYMFSTSAPLINTGTVKLGEMDISGWQQVQNILFDQKLISKKIDVRDAYTLQFLNTVYKQ